ncbi:MAG: class I SAM-dependent RNA methyltransferase [Candidatus Brocadiae bacterium]|nr:class I SAM-dependent RNA methyltransferase [Candidatus Brocadiia bacterium]
MNKTIECHIEKLLPEGGGLSQYKEKTLEVFNALPGEHVEALVFRKKTDRYRGTATKILQAAPYRQEPKEDHYLSCSPWQIMDFASENRFKLQIVQEILEKHGQKDMNPTLEAGSQRFQYRNKMEFGFTTAEGKIFLSFFERDKQSKIPISGCILAQKELQETALGIVDWINQNQIKEEILKSVMLRCNRKGEVLAGIFVNEEVFPPLDCPSLQHLKGLSIYFSNPQCPASVATKELYHYGERYITEILHGKKLQYGLMSFFQVNLDLFSMALDDIKPFLQGEEVLDCYSGVGSISLSVSESIKSCLLLDICEDSILLARENIRTLELDRFHAIRGETENLLEYMKPHKVVIVDPPRTGLHKKVIAKILKEKPKRLVYLSCNITTCLENISHLQPIYEVVFSKAYNFFPATSHLEFLVVLERQ